MSIIQFDTNVASSVAIDVANDVLPVWWMEVYPFRVNQSESLLHAKIKLLAIYIMCNRQSALKLNNLVIGSGIHTTNATTFKLDFLSSISLVEL